MSKQYIPGEIITKQNINYVVTDVLDYGGLRIVPLKEHIASVKVVNINGELMTIAEYLTREEGMIMEKWKKANEFFDPPDIFKKGFHVKNVTEEDKE